MPQNNTNHDWMIHGSRPDTNTATPRILEARSPNGRIYITVDQDTGQYWNPRTGTHEDGVHYPVSVYVSTHYEYYPRHDDGEFIDHGLVAHLRPGTSGQGWAATYDIARDLVVNGIASMERDRKWLTDPVDAPVRAFVNPRLNRDAATTKMRELIQTTSHDTETLTRQTALELAHDHEKYTLAEYLYSIGDDEFEWWIHDVSQTETASPA